MSIDDEEVELSTLGIDFGGSGIKGAIVNEEKGVLITERLRIATPEKAHPEGVAKVVRQITKHFEWDGSVGFGFPGIVRQGVAYSTANISKRWKGMDVDHYLTEMTGCPFFTINDADAAGIAEMKYGAGRGIKRGVVILLTIGTGIGSAVFVEGKLLKNTEFGHLQLNGKDVEARASDATRQRKELSWQQWAKRLQEMLDHIEAIFSPDLIIIGGGASKNSDKFFPYLKTNARLTTAQLQNNAGIIGAALYAAMSES